MVYVVAAYSITISVLLIYGVLLQHRARLAGSRPADGFNLGAALLAPVWAWYHGQRVAGAILLAIGVALAVAQAAGQALVASMLVALLLGAALFFGVAGNRLSAAAAHGADRAGAARPDLEAKARAQLRWALAGAVIHTVVVPWACYFWLAQG